MVTKNSLTLELKKHILFSAKGAILAKNKKRPTLGAARWYMQRITIHCAGDTDRDKCASIMANASKEFTAISKGLGFAGSIEAMDAPDRLPIRTEDEGCFVKLRALASGKSPTRNQTEAQVH